MLCLCIWLIFWSPQRIIRCNWRISHAKLSKNVYFLLNQDVLDVWTLKTSLREMTNYFCWCKGHLCLVFVLKPMCEICRRCAESVIFSWRRGKYHLMCEISLEPHSCLVKLFCLVQNTCISFDIWWHLTSDL